MKLLLLFVCLAGFRGTIGQDEEVDCPTRLQNAYTCIVDDVGSSGPPEEVIDDLLSCFEANGCTNPKMVKECIFDELVSGAFPDLMGCVSERTDLPFPDPDMFKPIASKFGPFMKFIKKAKIFKGRDLPPPMKSMIAGKLAMFCDGNEESASAALDCVKGKLDPLLDSLPSSGPPPIVKIFKCLKSSLTRECMNLVKEAAKSICCCAAEVGFLDKAKEATTNCGVPVEVFTDLDKEGPGRFASLICKKAAGSC
jgi:hypothetical protein